MTITKKALLMIFILIFLTALFLRILVITDKDIWMDEAITIFHGQKSIAHNIEWTKSDVHPPLYNVILCLWIRFFGISSLAARSLSLITGILALFMVYILSRLLCSDNKIPLLAMFFMAASSFCIRYSVEIRSYSLLCLFSMTSMYFFIKYILERKPGNSILFILSSTLLLYIHVYGIFIIIIQNIYWMGSIIGKRMWNRIFSWFIMQISTFILCLPYLLILKKQIAKVNSGFWIAPVTAGGVYKALADLTGGDILLFIIISLFAVYWGIQIFINNKKEINKQNSFMVLLYLWLLIPLILSITYSCLFQSIFMARYFMISLPPLFILLALKIMNLPVGKTIKAILILIISVLSYFSININPANSEIYQEPWSDICKDINAGKQNNDIIILEPFTHIYSFSYYYLPDFFKTAEDLYTGTGKYNVYVFQEFIRSFDEEIKSKIQERPVWLILGAEEANNPDNKIYRYLAKNKKLISRKYYVNSQWINVLHFM